MNNQCQGNCHEHKGEVVKIKLTTPPPFEKSIWDGLEFYYCENAIATDEANGFKCEKLNTAHG